MMADATRQSEEKARLDRASFSSRNQYAAFLFWLAWFDFNLNV
jgi:hypothetical protein